MVTTKKTEILENAKNIDFNKLISSLIDKGLKSGFKTSEFWFLVVANLIYAGLTSVGINPGIEVLVIANSVGLIYGVVRSIIKKDGSSSAKDLLDTIVNKVSE